MFALVALTEDLPGHRLTRGQIGSVIEHPERGDDRALLVEFSDEQGQTYAMDRCGQSNCLFSTGTPRPRMGLKA
ncbi:MAG: DUF4926 domain-containing protein [Bryobacteraceae bacterium]|jgi:hypothetical protein